MPPRPPHRKTAPPPPPRRTSAPPPRGPSSPPAAPARPTDEETAEELSAHDYTESGSLPRFQDEEPLPRFEEEVEQPLPAFGIDSTGPEGIPAVRPPAPHDSAEVDPQMQTQALPIPDPSLARSSFDSGVDPIGDTRQHDLPGLAGTPESPNTGETASMPEDRMNRLVRHEQAKSWQRPLADQETTALLEVGHQPASPGPPGREPLDSEERRKPITHRRSRPRAPTQLGMGDEESARDRIRDSEPTMLRASNPSASDAATALPGPAPLPRDASLSAGSPGASIDPDEPEELDPDALEPYESGLFRPPGATAKLKPAELRPDEEVEQAQHAPSAGMTLPSSSSPALPGPPGLEPRASPVPSPSPTPMAAQGAPAPLALGPTPPSFAPPPPLSGSPAPAPDRVSRIGEAPTWMKVAVTVGVASLLCAIGLLLYTALRPDDETSGAAGSAAAPSPPTPTAPANATGTSATGGSAQAAPAPPSIATTDAEKTAVAALEQLRKGVQRCVSESIGVLPGTSPPVPPSMLFLRNGAYKPVPRDWATPVYFCTQFELDTPMPFVIQWQQLSPKTQGKGLAWIDADGDGKAERVYSFFAELKERNDVEVGQVEIDKNPPDVVTMR